MAKMEWRGFNRKYFAWDSIIFKKVFPIANFDEAEPIVITDTMLSPCKPL